MSLPALYGETQPVASTSGRVNDSYCCFEQCCTARRHQIPLSRTTRRMPLLFMSRSMASAMTGAGHAEQRVCAVAASTRHQRPGQRAVYLPSACSEALFSHACIPLWDVRDHLATLQKLSYASAVERIPEHWLKHMQRVGDARSMKGYAHRSGRIKQHE